MRSSERGHPRSSTSTSTTSFSASRLGRPCISYGGGGGCHVTTSDPIAEIIGDYRAFAAMQRDRLLARGIDIAPYPLSHLAVRVADWDLYVHQRTLLERHATANNEFPATIGDRQVPFPDDLPA